MKKSAIMIVGLSFLLAVLVACVAAAAPARASQDSEGELVWKIEYRSDIRTTHYVYNALGDYERIEEMVYPDTEPYNTRTYTYNAGG